MNKNLKGLLLSLLVLFVAVAFVCCHQVTSDEPEVVEVTETTNEQPTTVDIKVVIENQSSFYGKPLKELTFLIGNKSKIVEGDEIIVTPLFPAEFEDGKVVDAGEYPIEANIDVISNSGTVYNVDVDSGIYKIKPIEICIYVPDVEQIYGNELQPLTYEVLDMEQKAFYGVSPKVELSVEAGENVGEYPITVKVEENKNWEAKLNVGTYKVIPRPLMIKVDNKQSKEGENFKKLTGTVEGVLPGEDARVSYHKAAGIDPGKYEIIASVGNKNYVAEKVITGIYTILDETGKMKSDSTVKKFTVKKEESEKVVQETTKAPENTVIQETTKAPESTSVSDWWGNNNGGNSGSSSGGSNSGNNNGGSNNGGSNSGGNSGNTKPTEPTTSTKPTNPTEPTTSTKPTNPTEPTTSTRPTNPTNPTTPPTRPTNPTTPPTKPAPEESSPEESKDETLPAPVLPEESTEVVEGTSSEESKDETLPAPVLPEESTEVVEGTSSEESKDETPPAPVMPEESTEVVTETTEPKPAEPPVQLPGEGDVVIGGGSTP